MDKLTANFNKLLELAEKTRELQKAFSISLAYQLRSQKEKAESELDNFIFELRSTPEEALK